MIDQINFKDMKTEVMNSILRNLLVAGNIVTVRFEEMREIRKELNRFANEPPAKGLFPVLYIGQLR